jgi:Cu+-exporting ATPase
MEAESAHPLARAILARARAEGIPVRAARKIETVVGRGLRSAEPPLALGSSEFLKAEGVGGAEPPPEIQKRQNRGETVIGLGVPGGDLIGWLALADPLKPGAVKAIEDLRALGLRSILMSGDSLPAVRAVAQLLKLDGHRARVAPEAKAGAVKEMQAAGARVAMVGDGINDSPALAQADLGIAMAAGSDIAQQAAGIVLLSGDPRQVAEAIRLARAVRAKMIQNLGWAFVYNLALIPLAASGHLSPIFASAAMAASSVSVVGNALLLFRWGSSEKKSPVS